MILTLSNLLFPLRLRLRRHHEGQAVRIVLPGRRAYRHVPAAPVQQLPPLPAAFTPAAPPAPDRSAVTRGEEHTRARLMAVLGEVST